MSRELKLIDPNTVAILALDLGVEHTGASLWVPGKSPIITQIEGGEKFLSAKSYSMANKVVSFAYGYEATKFREDYPLLLVCEDYAYGGGRSFNNVLQPEIVGAIKALLADRMEAGMIFVSASTIKKTVAGNGKATKAQVKRAVKAAGYDTKSSHEADSIAVYLTYKEIWEAPTKGIFSRSLIRGISWKK